VFLHECTHEIDFISNGCKLILIYDVLSIKPTCCYNVDVNDAVVQRVTRIFDTWIDGLENNLHGYSSKIVLPFSDVFQSGNNPLLYGTDRIIGTILRRTIEQHPSHRFLLYQGIIQPNRSNDATVHACRLLTDLNLMIDRQCQAWFDHVDLCLGNCNETYSGNIFLRRTRSEQG
jgi:hypothetical protein